LLSVVASFIFAVICIFLPWEFSVNLK
jgi:hypothetical protein